MDGASRTDSRAEQRQQALKTRLAALNLPEGGPAQAAARDRLAAMGLPHPRDEYWLYTNPAALNAAQPAPVAATAAADGVLFEGLNRLRLVFVDGRFDAAASDPLVLDGAEIATLAQGAAWADALYGTLEAEGQAPVARPLATLNTAAAQDGLLIRVTGKPARPIHIIHRRADPAADPIWHHVIRVEPGAEATVLETGSSGARFNSVIEADIADTGRLHHLTAMRAEHDRVSVAHIFARLGAESLFKSFALTADGLMMRNESVVWLNGDDGVAHVAAAVLGDAAESEFHHDDTVFITHAAERCESRQVFKKVLKNGAVGVFQGKILVKPGAQKTDGYQISQALLLDEGSQFLGKPELEIYADDVKCSHGSTTGAIDEGALFYLRSRGVPKDRAIVLLVLSFLADTLEEIEDETLREQISDRLETWLTRHSG
ncbi:MAG: SufD family Fe-S cluster assembly protein [Paracoccus sp. (in: a-proteobacteria)]|uniref:SufB/SufD family protein n=1 Tax=Paracoccus sp. TaxID=267 RepID=UPI0026DFC326|nr:SufD family Fe-S cluster assembly protein [Paracoccus sp. (in: a-proteobacteria)]MDO5620366.1 SufD family Fe-S cluster assembly protein [Paracoccus sp. (in: a-proteobacteria)]